MNTFQGLNDILSGAGLGSNSPQVQDLVKAVMATDQTGTQYWNTENAGASVKLESLEPTLKVITAKLEEAVCWKMIPKKPAFNTVEEFNQLVNYGSTGSYGMFTPEAQLGEYNDSTYNRRPVYIKYAQTVGQVSMVMDHVRVQQGIEGGSMLRQEQSNRTTWLIQQVDRALGYGNSSLSPMEFDGIYKLHETSVADSHTNPLEKYFSNSDICIDAKGYRLDDDLIEASTLGVRQNWGFADTLFTTPSVLSDYNKSFHESKRVLGNTNYSRDVFGGNKVNYTVSQFGVTPLFNDVLWKKPNPRVGTDPAQGVAGKTPAAPTADPTTPVATITDVNGRFGGTAAGFGAGDVLYAVASVNANGVSAMTVLSKAATTVSATQAVDLKFTITDNANPATGFVIYRTKTGNLDTTTLTNNKFYPILNISRAEHTAGYSGAAATLVRDRNYYLPDTDKAFVTEFSPEILALHQLIPLMKMPLAYLGPMHRFMVMMGVGLALYAPKKMAVVHNIGSAPKA